MKKIPVMFVAGVMAFMLSSCGQAKDAGEVQTDTVNSSKEADETDLDGKEDTAYDVLDYTAEKAENEVKPEQAVTVKESDVQTGEDANAGMTAEELLDAFVNGSVCATRSTDLTSTFYITDLDMESGEWDSYSIGEKEDLDNDGENELIICGPYGGIYLDARDGRVYVFAEGEGTGYGLSYVVYNGDVWIMYSSRMHAEYEVYHMEKFEGADNLVAEMNFGQELVDENDIESGMKYTWNGTEISSDEYAALGSRILATEVNTD